MKCPYCRQAVPLLPFEEPPAASLTKQQSAVLATVWRLTHEQGYPPSVREIGKAMGLLSSATVHGHLDTLQRKGCIQRDPERPRTIRPLVLAPTGNEKTPSV